MLARVCDFAVLHTVKSKNASFYGKAVGFAKILPNCWSYEKREEDEG